MIFDQYKNKNSNKIESDGIQRFYDDIGVDPMDIITLLISKYMNAETMGIYTFEELDNGFKALGVTSMDELRKRVPNLRQDLKDSSNFKELYKYVFDFSRD